MLGGRGYLIPGGSDQHGTLKWACAGFCRLKLGRAKGIVAFGNSEDVLGSDSTQEPRNLAT